MRHMPGLMHGAFTSAWAPQSRPSCCLDAEAAVMMRNSSMWENKSCPGSVPTLIQVSRCISGYLGHTTSMHHVDALLRRGERKMAACVSWTSVVNLPLCFVERIFKNYVCPSARFGLEFVPAGPQLRRCQTRFLQWGRRLLAWLWFRVNWVGMMLSLYI